MNSVPTLRGRLKVVTIGVTESGLKEFCRAWDGVGKLAEGRTVLELVLVPFSFTSEGLTNLS